MWTSDGTAGGSGPSLTLTFPSAGLYSVKLTYRDLAGNSATAFKSVQVSASSSTPPDNRPLPTFTLSGKGNGASAKVSGSKVKITVRGKIKVPAGVNAKAACTGTVLLTIKKDRTLLTARNAKLGRTCAFSKTISISRSKVGGAKKLSITVRFQGNSLLKPKTQNLTAKIRRLDAGWEHARRDGPPSWRASGDYAEGTLRRPGRATLGGTSDSGTG